MFPRALQELLQSSPRQPPSDAICLIPRCSNQGSCGRLSSVSLTHMVFHDSLFLSVSPPSTAAQRGCIQAGPENRDRLTATTAAMPRGSGWQSSGVTQVEKSFSSALIRMHPFLPSAIPGEASRKQGSSCVQRNSSLRGAAQLSRAGQESPAQRKTTQGQKRAGRSLPSPITGLTESTLEEKKGNHFSSAVRRFTASDPIFPLPNRDRLKKLESDEMMLLSRWPSENPSTTCHVLVRLWALSLQCSSCRGPVKHVVRTSARSRFKLTDNLRAAVSA